MSYSIDLEREQLLARSRKDALAAAKIVNSDQWLQKRMHVAARPTGMPAGAPQWRLVVESFDGHAWNEAEAFRVWSKLIPLLAERAALEIRTEQGERLRYRWEYGRVHQDEVALTIWRAHSILGPFTPTIEPDPLPRSAQS